MKKTGDLQNFRSPNKNERTETAVSATEENNTRDSVKAAKQGVKEARIKKQEQEAKKKQTINTIIGVICSLLVLGLVLFNQGYFTKTYPAITIDGTVYTADHVKQFYTTPLYSALMGQVEPDGGIAYDMSIPADEQYYSLSMTWHEYFVDQAINQLAEIHILSEKAMASGFQLPQEALDQLASTQYQLDTSWIGYYSNKESFIRGQYGSSMTEAGYLDMVTRELYSNYYQTAVYDDLEFSDEEYEAYYQENKDTLDMVTYSQFHFTTTPLELEVNEEGETEEPTEDQITLFDAEKESLNVRSDDLIALLADGATIEDVIDAFSSIATTYSISDVAISTALASNDNYGTWLLEEDRQFGDYQKSGAGTGYNATYTVTIFESRDRQDEVTSNIRHIYIGANETGEAPTDEEWDAALVKAEEMLENWLDDGANLDTFAELAQEHSADAGSAAVGGVIENVSTMSGYVDTFANWATDSTRTSGDTGIVQNTGSATQGYHIMYFEDWNLPMWKLSSEVGLANTTIEQWREDLFADLDSKVIKGEGINDVEMVSLF